MQKTSTLIDLAWCGSLYEPSADSHIKLLNDALDKEKPGQIFIIRVQADCHDYSNSWLNYIRQEALWQDLATRMLNWHKIFSRIIQSKSRWFFAANGDVVGSWWELAIACHGRILTNPYAKVGFPDIFIDLYSPLGVLGLKRIKPYGSPAQLRSHAIMHAREAYKLGIVNLCLLDSSWILDSGIATWDDWFKKFINVDSSRIGNKQDYTKLMPTIDALEKIRPQLSVRRDWLNKLRVDNVPNAKDKSIHNQAKMMAEHCAAAAMRFLMNDYHAWLSRRVSRYRLGLHDRWWSKANDTILIDVTAGIPPQEVVMALFVRRKKIIFGSKDHKKLQTALETLRSRFDRLNNAGEEAFSNWNQSVNWLAADIESVYRDISCKFYENDFLEVSRGEELQRYFRISGNFNAAGIGWCEELNTSESEDDDLNSELEEIDETVSLMINGKLKAKKLPHPKFPLTVTLRLMLLEVILRQVELIPNLSSVTDYLKLLTSSGWGFASDQFQWDHLLKTHPPSKDLVEKFKSLFPPDTNFKILSIESVLNYKIPKLDSPQKIDIRSGAAATRLLGVFAHKVVHWLVESGYVSTLEEADLFVTLSWGYPGALQLPHYLVRDFGPRRISYWDTEFSKLKAEASGI